MTRSFAPISAITVTGFAGAAGQVLILRELLVLFYGNELSTGLVFAGWLLWTAVGSGLSIRLSAHLSGSPVALPFGLAALAVLLPSTLLWIRASRPIWAIPAGEVISPGLMLGICLSSISLFCFASGFLFALAWSVTTTGPTGKGCSPTAIYLGEAAGATMGGLCFYFLLLPYVAAFTAASLLSGILTAAACILLTLDFGPHRSLTVPQRAGKWKKPMGGRPFHRLWCFFVLFSACLVMALVTFSSPLDKLSRRWQWNADPILVVDSPFHNLALLKNEDQFSLFANGLWLFSVPDPQMVEQGAHLALLQHPCPRTVLILGGGATGLLSETLKHGDIQVVDTVEPDPEVMRIVQDHLLSALGDASGFKDPRTHIFYMDAGSFIRHPPRTYDVVLLNTGEPLNAEMNRFYTNEFYKRIAGLLNPGGILSFGISSAPDIIGPSQARFLRSIHTTLRSVFPAVLVYPGESARFFASSSSRNLVKDPLELVRRIVSRHLDLQYVREYYLFDQLNPLRMEYVKSILEEDGTRPPAVNREFTPTCYFNNLIVWSAQLHPRIERALLALAGIGRPWLWIGLGVILLLGAGIFRFGRPTPWQGVCLSVTVVGGTQMALEIILLLAFQTLEGFLYTQMVLIVTLFMAGMALGAAIVVRLSPRIRNPRRWLIRVHAFLCIYLLGLIPFLLLIQEVLETPHQNPTLLSVAFSALAGFSGTAGGLHFSLATQSTVIPNRPAAPFSSAATAGPRLYALDLAGAAVGALTTSLFFLPIYGLVTTMLFQATLVLTSLLVLLGSR